MKICWDNLEPLRYSKNKGCWYKRTSKYVYYRKCKICGEPYLGKTYNKGTCDKACARKGWVLSAESRNKIRRSNKIYSIDENYFTDINNEKKAYWLGFIMADGCVMIRNNAYTFRLAIKDEGHLEQLRKDIGFNGKIYMHKTSSGEYPCIRIHNKWFIEKLIQKGVVPRKTWKLKFPDFIPESLMNHFIRGYFDGDGWISYMAKLKNQKVLHRVDIGVVGRKVFLKKMATILKVKCSLLTNSVRREKRNKDLWVFNKSCYQAAKICMYLYSDATIYLDRKYQKYEKFIRLRIKADDKLEKILMEAR